MTRRGLGAAIVGLLVVGSFVVGLRWGSDERERIPPSSTSTAAPGPAVQPPGAVAPVPDPESGDTAATASTPGQAQFEASARSIVLDPVVLTASSLTFDEPLRVQLSGRVTDSQGHDLGTGFLRTESAARLSGDLQLRAVLVVVGAEVRLGRGTAATFDFTSTSTVTLEGADMEFSVPAEGEESSTVKVTGPVTIDGPTGGRSDGSTVWVDAPPVIEVSSEPRATVTWAGPGSVTTDAGLFEGEFVGLKGVSLGATIHRDAAGLTATGTLVPQQIYVDGAPRLAATGNVVVKRTPDAVRPGEGSSFTWAPINAGATDMAITSVRPGNDLAHSVNLALDRLPELCGAERCPFGALGGDTTGFTDEGGLFGGGASPINAVILPATGDERDISFTIPDDWPPGAHEIVVVFEGNFDPITINIPVQVAP